VGGRLPGPTLLAKLLFEVLRDDIPDLEDVNEVFRAPVNAAPAPTRDVPFTVDREPVVVMLDRAGSPARSASVFRFGSISLTKRIEADH
jgi:hypothetical protein